MNRATYFELIDRLSRTKTQYAECIKIVRTDGVVFRFTAHNQDLVLTESDNIRYTYKAAASFQMSALESQANLAVSNVAIDAIISDDSITENDLNAGKFKFAQISILLAYWSNQGVLQLPLKNVWIGAITLQDTAFKADLRGLAQQLSQIFTETTSLKCRWNFCDGNCGLSETAYSSTFTVTSTGANDSFLFTPSDLLSTIYTWGKVEWLTGQNAGLTMEIIRHVSTKIDLFMPMPYQIMTGDTCKLVQGCDKNYNTCVAYGNHTRFGGEPFLVGSDLLARYPNAHNN